MDELLSFGLPPFRHKQLLEGENVWRFRLIQSARVLEVWTFREG